MQKVGIEYKKPTSSARRYQPSANLPEVNEAITRRHILQICRITPRAMAPSQTPPIGGVFSKTQAMSPQTGKFACFVQAANLPLERIGLSANLRKVEKSALRKFLESIIVRLRFAAALGAARNKHPTPCARGSLMPGAGDETANSRDSVSSNLNPRRSNAFAELSALKEGFK